MSEKLFEGFSPVSKEAYRDKIIKDLKGKDYNSTLLWESENQVVQPFYHAEDLDQLINRYQGNLQPQIYSTTGNHWVVEEIVRVEEAEKANKTALALLNNGVEAICFDLNCKNLDDEIYNKLVKDILLEVAPVRFVNYAQISLEQVSSKILLAKDWISESIKNNDAYKPSEFENQLQLGTAYNLNVDTAIYQNAGATIIDQLAFSVAIISEYLQSISISKHNQVTGVYLSLALGSNFFFEISKIRALKKLLVVLLKQFNLEHLPVYLGASATGVNKSIADEHNNMLRNTAECMAAIVGGVNSVQINAHDFLHEETSNGKRWARNIAHILRKESYFDKVADPTKGSYYIEELTDKFATEAWEEFKLIETEGGFLEAVSKGIIQKKIQKNANALKLAVESKDIVLVGVNKYEPTSKPESLNNLEQSNSGFLKPLRLAEPFE